MMMLLEARLAVTTTFILRKQDEKPIYPLRKMFLSPEIMREYREITLYVCIFMMVQ